MTRHDHPRIRIDADGTIHRDDEPTEPNTSADAPVRDAAQVAAERVACATAQSQRTAPDDVGYLLLTCPSCGTKIRIARPADAHTTIRLTCPKCRREHTFRLGSGSQPTSPSSTSTAGGWIATILVCIFSATALEIVLSNLLGGVGITLGGIGGIIIAALYRKNHVKRKSS